MLEVNRKDLASEKQKKLLRRMVDDLSQTDPDLYYRSTADIAAILESHITKGSSLNGEERTLMGRMTRRDLEVLLSLN